MVENNLLTKEEIDKKIGEIVYVIDQGNVFLQDSDKLNLDATKKALATHNESDIVAALKEVESIKGKTPLGEQLASSLNQMLSSYHNVTVGEHVQNQETEKLANDRLYAANAWMSSLPDEEKLSVSAIEKALSTHDEADFANAIKEAEAIKNSGNPYGNDLLNSLNSMMNTYYNETVEDYNRKLDVEKSANLYLGAANAWMSSLPDEEKTSVESIRQALSTHDEADFANAIKEAEAIKNSGNPYGNDLLNSLNSMMNTYYNETVEDYNNRQESDRRINSSVAAVEAMNFNSQEEDKLSTEAIKQALETHNEADIEAAKKEAEAIKNSGNSYGEQILDSLNNIQSNNQVSVAPVVADAVMPVETVVEPNVVATQVEENTPIETVIGTNTATMPSEQVEVATPVESIENSNSEKENSELAVSNLNTEINELNEKLSKCYSNKEKIDQLKENYKNYFETVILDKKNKLSELNNIVNKEEEITIGQTLEPTKYYEAMNAYNVARDIPTVENIKSMFDKISLMESDVEEKEKLLKVGKKLVDKHITDPEELAEVNSFCISNGVDLSTIKVTNNSEIEAKKESLSKEIEELEQEYGFKLKGLEIINEKNNSKINEIQDKIAGKKNELAVIDNQPKLPSEDLDFGVSDGDLDFGVSDGDLDFSIDSNITNVDAENDSLNQPKTVRTIKSISKELYEKIRNSKFGEGLKAVVDAMRRHKVATVITGIIATVGILGTASVNAEIKQNMERMPDTTTTVSDNSISEETEVKKNDVETKKVEVEVEMPEIMAQNNVVNENTPSLEEASMQAIKDAASGEQKVYTSVDNAAQGINGLDAYAPSWQNATPEDYFTYDAGTGTLTAVNNNDAMQIYEDGGQLVQSVENDGTVVGYTAVR